MTVNILGTEYTVKLVKLPKNLYGDCDTAKKIIRINRQRDEVMETLVHEVVHATLFESGIIHILCAFEGLEEAVVRAIEHGLKTAGLIPEILANDIVDPNSSGDVPAGNSLGEPNPGDGCGVQSPP